MALVLSGDGAVGPLSATEVGYLDGVTSGVQTQLNAGGMVMLAPTSIANTGGTATLTNGAVTYSGVTSISLNGVFSATYQNYWIMFTTVLTGGADCFIRWRVAGTDATTSNYVQQFNRALNTTFLGGLKTATTIDGTVTGGTNSVFSGTVLAPFEANPTQHYITCGSEAGIGNLTGRHTLSNSYDGMSIYTASGSFAGTIRVYGYRNGI
jgi:hypothetical protein